MASGRVLAAYTPGFGGTAEAIFKMCIGNGIGFSFADGISLEDIFSFRYGSFILELSDGDEGIELGRTTDSASICFGGETVRLSELEKPYEDKLEPVYNCNIGSDRTCKDIGSYRAVSWPHPRASFASPRAVIPVFPGTNCEYDSAKALEAAGIKAECFIIRNLSSRDIAASVKEFAEKIRNSQIIFIPGGFSGGDEPDGSAKFITSFFRSQAVSDSVAELLEKRDGLMLGICNGFQALIKLGLVPFGRITPPDTKAPTLSFNTVGRHQSKLVRTRIVSNSSPWLMKADPEKIYTVPISHGEGRFVAEDAVLEQLIANHQIATQYVDPSGAGTYDIQYNPNGSALAVEGICSPDGRIFGKMGHSERTGKGLYQNVEGLFDMKLFESAAEYYK